MIKALKEYWVEVLIPALGWLKRHWFGIIVFYVVLTVCTLAWCKWYITGSLFKRKEVEERP